MEEIKKIVIIGTGGHSKVVLSEILQAASYKVLGFIDNFQPQGTIIDKDNNLEVLSTIENINSVIDDDTYGIVAIGSNFLRRKVVNEIESVSENFRWATIISINAIVDKNASINEGSIIITGSIINTGTNIKKHCIINTNTSIDHDNIFNEFSSTGPSVTTGGSVNIGELTHIGINSAITNNINIGTNTVIGGKSFVNKICDDNSVYYGVPIKKIKNRKEDESYL